MIALYHNDGKRLGAYPLANVYAYFKEYGVNCNPYRLATQLWIEGGRPAPVSSKKR